VHLGSTGGIGPRATSAIVVFSAGVGMGAAASGLIAGAAPSALLNLTPSEPLGFYVRTSGRPEVGRLIAFRPPGVAAAVGDGRLARYPSFLKQVAAAGGDLVCADRRRVSINGVPAGVIAQADHLGRTLPHWAACRRLGDGEVFVLSNRVSNSFDSRYFGPVALSTVLGVYRPIWTAP
jgi:conjugative transfer signal peptidase TraF